MVNQQVVNKFLNWKDPRINISWPIDNPILSERDKNSH